MVVVVVGGGVSVQAAGLHRVSQAVLRNQSSSSFLKPRYCCSSKNSATIKMKEVWDWGSINIQPGYDQPGGGAL